MKTPNALFSSAQQSRRTLVVLLLGSSLSLTAATSLAASADRSESSTARTPAGDVTRKDRTFVTKAAEMGLVEVAAARLALSRAQDSQVRAFAQMMLADHQLANSQLAAIATRRGIELPEGAVTAMERRDAMSSGHDAAGKQGAAGSGASGRAPTNSGAGPDRSTGAGHAPSAASGANAGVSNKTADMDALPSEHRRNLEQLTARSGAEFDQAYMKQMVQDHKEAIALFETAARDVTDSELKQFAAAQLPVLREHSEHAQSLAGGANAPRSGTNSTGSATGGARSGSGTGTGAGAGDAGDRPSTGTGRAASGGNR